MFKTLRRILRLKCPECGQTDLFTNPSLINLSTIGDMPKHCSHCNLDFEPEPGFYFGAMFLSYIVTAFLIFFILGISLLIWGSVSRTYLFSTLALIVLLWTYMFRFSRALWLSISNYLKL